MYPTNGKYLIDFATIQLSSYISSSQLYYSSVPKIVADFNYQPYYDSFPLLKRVTRGTGMHCLTMITDLNYTLIIFHTQQLQLKSSPIATLFRSPGQLQFAGQFSDRESIQAPAEKLASVSRRVQSTYVYTARVSYQFSDNSIFGHG